MRNVFQIGVRAALIGLLLTLLIPTVAQAQSPAAEARFHIGASLTGSFGPRSWLTPAGRASFQVTPRVGIDIDVGSAILATDDFVRAPRRFTTAFQVRIGSPHNAEGYSRYLVLGSRTVRSSFPNDDATEDTYARPYVAFGMDKHLENGLRAAGEIGVTAGFDGTILLFGFSVQWGPR